MNAQIPQHARCLGCGYPLRDLPGCICPECGGAFDPSDPRTYAGPPLPPFWQRYGWPPGWIHMAGAVFVALAFIESQSRMGMVGHAGGGIPCCVSLAVAPVLLAEYAIRFLMLCVRVVCPRPERQPMRPPPAWRWRITPACVLAAVTALFNLWPLHLRFAMSRGAFEAEVRKFLESNPPNETPVAVGHFVGLYYVKEMSRAGDVVHFDVRSAGAYAHLTYGGPLTPGSRDYVLSNNWIIREY